MFDIGWSELMVIGVVALVVIGPKELPTVLRSVGRTVGKVRRMAGEFQGQFQDALREAELAEMRKDIGDIAEQARGGFSASEVLDPLRAIREEIRSTLQGATPAVASDVASAPPAVASAPYTVASAPRLDDPVWMMREEIRAIVSASVRPAAATAVSVSLSEAKAVAGAGSEPDVHGLAPLPAPPLLFDTMPQDAGPAGGTVGSGSPS